MKIKRNILKSKKLKKKVYGYFINFAKVSRKEVDYLISKHFDYGTLVLDQEKYICLFNIVNEDAIITHLIGCNCGLKGIRNICSSIKNKYNVRDIVYEREFKLNNSIRRFAIERLIK